MIFPLIVNAEKVKISGIWYNLVPEVKEAKVTYPTDGTKYSGSVTIPTTVNYNDAEYNVTSIGVEAFNYCSSLTAITIPESVTSIGSCAFMDCSNLSSVFIPENSKLTSIGDYVFDECFRLTSIALPESVIEIGIRAFYRCSSLTSITIPAGVTSIGREAFSDCSSLTSISIPANVISIGSDAFFGCERLVSIVVSEENTNYDSRNNCNAIIETSSNTLIIGCGSTIIPEEVTSIGSGAFNNCDSLISITLPEGLTSIGNRAFEGCQNLASITIPSSVTSIGNSAFCYCISLKEIVFEDASTTLSLGYYSGYSYWTGLHCETGLFHDCPLEKVYLGRNLSYDDNYMSPFFDKNELFSVIIGESVTEIGSRAFDGCGSLASITIPESVTSIGGRAFSDCSGLTEVHINNIEAWCKILFREIDSNPLSCSGKLFLNGELVTNLVIPNGVTSVGPCAFCNCSSLNSVTIPTSVASINYGAFYSCNNLTSITIPESVTSIGERAFSDCSGLTSVVLPKSVQSIGDYAFANCSELENVYCNAENVPSAYWAFEISLLENATLHIPASAVENYKFRYPWSSFGTIEILRIAAEDITLSQSSVTLNEGETLTLTATILPDDATDKAIIWSSSSPSIAVVDAEGRVSALAPGTAVITAIANDGSGVSASCKVTVIKKVANISLNESSVTLVEGESLILTATVLPDDATDKAVIWSSSNSSIASVDDEGKISALSQGSAIITATANDGSEVSASCKVTVIKEVDSIALSESSVTLVEGESLTLIATVLPDDATDKSVTWSSSNSFVVTVRNGKVTAKAVGTAVITAKVGDKEATCMVTVTKKEDDNEDEDENGDGDKEDEDAGIESSTLNPQHSTEVYDLNGRRVLSTENLKGLYIVDGKKVIFK